MLTLAKTEEEIDWNDTTDTDEDGLPDVYELYYYCTDPVNPDTDGDEVSDGDEIALGLNPNAAATNGIPDNERTFEQTIEPDDPAFTFINTEDNPYKVSLEVKAAGVLTNNLEAGVSGYSYAMRNEAILGTAPEFEYPENLKIDSVTVNFALDESAAANTNGKYAGISDEFAGIKRFNVFRYFEESNMLLPIETFHDTANNRVYANTGELGTYCLVDMEIWLDSLGIEPQEKKPQARIMSLSNSEDMLSSVPKGSDLDIVFVIYTSNGFLSNTKTDLLNTSEKIFTESKQRNINTRIYYISYLGTPIPNLNNNTNYAENTEDSEAIIKRAPGTKADTKYYEFYRSMNYIYKNLLGEFRENSSQYCFVIDEFCYPECTLPIGSVTEIQNAGVKLQFIYDNNNENKNKYISMANGLPCRQLDIASGFYFCDFVVNQLFDESVEPLQIISSVGLTKLPEDFGEISANSGQDYDKDGISDADEIYFEAAGSDGSRLVTVNADGTVELPSFNECVKAGNTYVQSGLERFKKSADESVLRQLDIIRVLPIKSDPTSEDGDGDGYVDGAKDINGDGKTNDPRPLKCDVFKYSLQPDFVPIMETDGNQAYGGNQSWYGPQNSAFNNVIYNGGCGLISFCDVLAYLDRSGKCPGITSLNTTGTISQVDYMAYIDTIYSKTLMPIKVPGFMSEGTGTWGTTPSMYYKAFNTHMLLNLNNSHILPYTANAVFSDPDKLFKKIENRIENGYPVPMFIEMFTTIPFYNTNMTVYDSGVSYHWVTITGIERDDVTGEKIFHISSWGKELIIKYDDWYNDGLTNNTVLL